MRARKSEQWSSMLHPCSAHCRIFVLQKYAAILQHIDTVSVPCFENGIQNEAKSLRMICVRFDKRKTARLFFVSRLKRANPSSSQLATSA